MRKLFAVIALVAALTACASSGATADDCEGARQVYQDRIAFVFVGDSLRPSPEYRAMSKAEQNAYDEGTASALDAMNKACGTGPYA